MRNRKVPGKRRDKGYRNPPAKPGSVQAQISHLKALAAAQNAASKK